MKNLQTSERISSKNQEAKTAYGYARTATKKSANESNSIEEQSSRIREYCSKNGIKLLKIYSDSAKPGIKLDRPALMCLFRKVRQTPVNHVVITDNDRLARDVTQFLIIRNLLIKSGTKIVKANGQNIDSDPYSMFFDEMLACVNAFHSKLINKKRNYIDCSCEVLYS